MEPEKLSNEAIGTIVELIENRRLAEVATQLPLYSEDMIYIAVEALEAGPLDAFVLFLLDNGLDVDGEEGVTSILAHAAGEARPDVVKLLLERGATLKGIPLVYAVQGGDIEVVRLLITAGAHRGNRGFPTPLKMAQMKKRPDIEKLLIEHGATELVGKGRSRPEFFWK